MKIVEKEGRYSEKNRDFGRRIREIREALNLKEKEFAETLNLSYSYYNQIENGNGNPGLDFFYDLIEKYHINMEYLFHGRGEITFDSKGEPVSLAELKSKIDSIDKLVWVSEHSQTFRMSILAKAHRIIMADGEYIKKEIKQELEKKQKAQKDEED